MTELCFCQSVYSILTNLPHRWREGEEEETREGKRINREGERIQKESEKCPKEEEE